MDIESYHLMTKECYNSLESKLLNLKLIDRPRITLAISEAKAWGDLSENAEYQAACEQQRYIEKKIVEVINKLARAKIVDQEKIPKDSIRFGATVKLLNKVTRETLTYKLVGTDEANLNDGLLSILSPLSRALIGKSFGQIVEVVTPSGLKTFEIIDLFYEPS